MTDKQWAAVAVLGLGALVLFMPGSAFALTPRRRIVAYDSQGRPIYGDILGSPSPAGTNGSGSTSPLPLVAALTNLVGSFIRPRTTTAGTPPIAGTPAGPQGGSMGGYRPPSTAPNGAGSSNVAPYVPQSPSLMEPIIFETPTWFYDATLITAPSVDMERPDYALLDPNSSYYYDPGFGGYVDFGGFALESGAYSLPSVEMNRP